MPNLLLKQARDLKIIKSSKAVPEHEYLITISDKRHGLKAFIAIHSTFRGPAHGGTRMKVYKNESEAIRDVLELSEAMSYKAALAGLPYGGAKGVIMLTEEPYNRDEILKAYAQKIEKLGGLFQTGTDVGLTDDDTLLMAQHSRFILGLPSSEKGELTTSHAAADGVLLAMKAASQFNFGTDNLAGMTIGIKGVGKLGGELARLLLKEGAKLIVADTSKEALKHFEGNSDIKLVDTSEIHAQEMNIYAPCALGHEFTPKVIRELRCDIIAGGANNQLPNFRSGDDIAKKGILYVPDYIANAGGLIFVSEDLESDGFHADRVDARLKHITDTVTLVLERAQQEKLPTHRIADKMGRELLNNTV